MPEGSYLNNVLTYGLCIQMEHIPLNTVQINFDSDDGTNKPQIAVSYQADDVKLWRASCDDSFSSTYLSQTGCNAMATQTKLAGEDGIIITKGYIDEFVGEDGQDYFLGTAIGETVEVPNKDYIMQKVGIGLNGGIYFHPENRTKIVNLADGSWGFESPQNTFVNEWNIVCRFMPSLMKGHCNADVFGQTNNYVYGGVMEWVNSSLALVEYIRSSASPSEATVPLLATSILDLVGEGTSPTYQFSDIVKSGCKHTVVHKINCTVAAGTGTSTFRAVLVLHE